MHVLRKKAAQVGLLREQRESVFESGFVVDFLLQPHVGVAHARGRCARRLEEERSRRLADHRRVLRHVVEGQALEALETLASEWIRLHPEYHAELSDVDAALASMLKVDPNKDNPFLHLSMHLSISEQCSIDQPRGIRQAIELLTARCDSLHEAHHQAMECMGQMLWESQRSGRPPDGQAYTDCVQRRATRD